MYRKENEIKLGQITMLQSCSSQRNKGNPTFIFRASSYHPLGKRNISSHSMKYYKIEAVTWEGQ